MYADPGRGDYEPPAAAPESQWVDRWVAYPGTLLPRPTGLFRAACMKPSPRRRENRLLQRTGQRNCRCWYHAGNWHTAAEIAIAALNAARRDHPDLGDADALAAAAIGLLPESSSQEWTSQAAFSLLSDPIILEMPTGTDYINGQHRGEALIDQQVATVPVIVSVRSDSPPSWAFLS